MSVVLYSCRYLATTTTKCQYTNYLLILKEHKHLPEIPSTNEVVKDGIDLGEMNAKLLQKIEQLTFYMIAQQKEIDEQQKELKAIKEILPKTEIK